jgi:hypothetical protein
MMTAREQAEQLRQQAIQTLLEEKKAIDGMLRTLGYEETVQREKRRGRRPRQQAGEDCAMPTLEPRELNDSGISTQASPAVAQTER